MVPVTAPIAVLLHLLSATGDMSRPELLTQLGLKDRKHLRERYLAPAIDAGWVAMTLPDKPQSRDQRYQLTAAGRAVVGQLASEDGTVA
jgi:ATP-dependent DNA helicase RecG